MLQWISGASARYRLLVLAVAAALLAVGIARLPATTLEALPDFGPVRVEIQTEALGLSPEEAENLITNPMEQEFFTGIPWLHKIRSVTAPGLSSVEMIFEPGTNDIRARQVVQERLTMVPALPAVSKPPFVIQPSATTSRLMMISMSSDEVSLVDMSTLARWKIRQRLLAVPGVSNVSIWGLRDRQLQVLVDPYRLRLNRVNVDDVIRTAANAMWSSPLTYVEASTPGTGGFIDTANQRISINHTQPIKTAAELAKVSIETDLPKPLTLGEVADVVEGHQLLIGDALVQGHAGLMLVVERTPGSSIAATTRDVEHALDSMRPGLKGIRLDSGVFRADSFTEAARANLVESLGLGLLLMVVLAGALLLDWRSALVSLVVIVFSLSTALLVLSAFGLSLNMMVVAGLVLVLAVLVDDAVAAVDNLRRRLAQRAAEQPNADGRLRTLVAASREVAAPLLTALAIALISIAPALVFDDIGGSFIKPLLASYAVALLVSMLTALLLTPALASVLLPRAGRPAAPRPPLARALATRYTSFAARFAMRPAWPLVVGGLMVICGAALLPRLGEAPLMPPLQDRDLVVRMQAAPGTSLPAMTRMVTAATAQVRALPGVRSVGAHIGRASNSDLVNGIDRADLWVAIAPDAAYAPTYAAIEKAVHGLPGLSAELAAYPNLRLREVGAAEAESDDLVVRVYGRDYAVLEEKAKAVVQALAEVPGLAGTHIVPAAVEPMVEVEVDVDKASAVGVKPGDARRAAATLLSSIVAGNLFEEQKIFDVVVWGQPEQRASLSSVRDLLIDTLTDKQVRLGDVADVRIRPNPSVIRHDAVSRYVDVTARVDGASLAGVTRQVEQRLKTISFPSEHHVEILGDAAEHERTHRRLLLYGIAAAIAVFFVLQAIFDSWRLGALMFAALLLPLGGAALGAAAMGASASVLSLLGALVVVVLALRGALLFVARCRSLERDEGWAFGPELVAQAAAERFDAAVPSTLASLLLLLPLLFWPSLAGLEIARPMAATIIGGLLATAWLQLALLPALYLRFAKAGHASLPPALQATPAAGAAS